MFATYFSVYDKWIVVFLFSLYNGVEGKQVLIPNSSR